MKHELTFDDDDWGVLRLAELAECGVKAELRVVLDPERGNAIVEVYIQHADGKVEHAPRLERSPFLKPKGR